MNNYKIQIATDKDDLALQALKTIVKYIEIALSKKKRVQIALSGGSTPSNVYKLLADQDVNWSKVDVFLGDERWVDSSDSLSNALMLRETLLSKAPASQACFYPIPTTQLTSPQKSAEAFYEILKEKCNGNPPVFDLMLLGLGEDGHTASLFPDSNSLSVLDKWTTVSRGKGQDRITLTAKVLSASSKVIFLVSGNTKQNALKRLIDPDESPLRTPAKLVESETEILVLADKAASELILN